MYEKVRDCFAFVKTPTSRGSAVVVTTEGKKYLYTNRHVIMKSNDWNCFETNVEARLMNGTKLELGEIEWAEEWRDLVRYPVDPSCFGIKIDEKLPNFKDEIAVFGDSGGIGTLSCSTGIVLSIGNPYSPLVEITADFANGNSGGPVINKRGRLIGLATATLSAMDKSSLMENSRYAKPRNFATQVSGCRWTTSSQKRDRDRLHFEKLKMSAQAGDVVSQFKYGVALLRDARGKTNAVEAIVWLQKAAQQGHPDAQYELGRCYGRGEGIPRNEEESLRLIKMAAKSGVRDAMSEMWRRNRRGEGIPKNLEQAVQLGQRLAKDGDVEAQFELGKSYFYGAGVERNLRESAEWIRRAADKGNIPAMTWYGKMLMNGQGVPKNEKEGFARLEQAALKDYPEAMRCLSVCLQRGWGCDKNPIRAVTLLQKAADAGDARAMYLLFERHRDGEGFQKDTAEALRYLELSARSGDGIAQRVLGDSFCGLFCNERECVAQKENLDEATNWWTIAASPADSNNSRAQYRMGSILLHGYGKIRTNRRLAISYLSQSATNQNVDAQRKLAYEYLCDRPEDNVYWLKKLMESGDLKAKLYLSYHYREGYGVLQDKLLAEEFAREVARYCLEKAESGEPWAMTTMSSLYREGWGVPQDLEKCILWMRKSANAGDGVAQFGLGWCYATGTHVKKSVEEAARLYHLAIRNECWLAYPNLGRLYEAGEGVETNLEKAVSLYREGAEKGDACSQWNLGNCYVNGKGVERNLEKGKYWLRCSAEQLYFGAIRDLVRLYGDPAKMPDDFVFDICKRYFEREARMGDEDAAQLLKEIRNAAQ